MRGMNMLPPAIALFSALLKKEGHTVSFFDATDYPNPEMDFNSDKQKEENLNARPYDASMLRSSWKEENVFDAYMRKVNEFKPDLLAVSCTEDMYPIGLSLLERSKSLKIPTIMGGVFPTFAPEVCIANETVDIVCKGEGEKPFVELCRRMEAGLKYDDIPGLWVKSANGKVTVNEMGPAVDINSNPILDLSIFTEGRLYRPMQGKVWKMFPLETHRGCPYKCAYCNSPSQSKMYKDDTSSSFFRRKAPEKIREEIIFFKENYDVEAFYFWADTFFAYTPKEFDAFVEMYSEFKIPFWCQTRPETIRRERLQSLKDVGLFRMAFGIEHGNHEFRKKYIGRNVQNEVMIRNLEIVNEVGVPFSVNNILGFPYETRELAFDTIELNRHIHADSTNAYAFSPFHGTPLRKIAEKEGYIDRNLIARSITRPTMLNMPTFTLEEIEGLRRTFVMYAKMPKSRWKDIEKAEKLTPEGDQIWEELKEEMTESKLAFHKDGDGVDNFEKMAMGRE